MRVKRMQSGDSRVSNLSYLCDEEDRCLSSVLPKIDSEGKPNDGIVAQSIRSKLADSNQELNDKLDGLAVACVVSDMSDHGLQRAVELDRMDKPASIPRPLNRLILFLVCLVFVLLIVVIVVVVVLKKEWNKDSAVNPAIVRPLRDSIGIRESISRTIGSDKLLDPESTYSQALYWIMYNDPLKHIPTQKNFIQRYILSYVYFTTSIGHSWTFCGRPSVDESSSCTNSNDPDDGPEGITMTRWLSNTSECQWAGVSCNEDNQIVAIDISGMNLTGSVPEGLVFLPYLESINLAFGYLSSTLPEHLLELQSLKNLDLQANFIVGTIPDEWFLSQSIQKLNLAFNLLEGTIPTTIGQASGIKSLFLFGNMLSGSLPREIAKIESLQNLRFFINLLEGSIPTIGAKDEQDGIVEVMINKNIFTGEIPSSLFDSRSLLRVDLSNNLLTGGLPASLYHATGLLHLELGYNQLNGTVSSAIARLSQIVEIKLNNNQMSGHLPIGLDNLVNLERLWLANNDFTGLVPPGLCGITDFQADCFASNPNNLPKVICSTNCCTVCCDDMGHCVPVLSP